MIGVITFSKFPGRFSCLVVSRSSETSNKSAGGVDGPRNTIGMCNPALTSSFDTTGKKPARAPTHPMVSMNNTIFTQTDIVLKPNRRLKEMEQVAMTIC
jgi:hypothetical protein